MIVKEEFLSKLRRYFALNLYEVKIWTALLSRGVSTAGELSDIANVPRSRSYDVLESLEKKGFAERMRNSPDRRVITIQLTETGKKLAENAPPPIQQKIIDGLSQTEKAKIEQIARSLSMLTDMLDVQDLEVK